MFANVRLRTPRPSPPVMIPGDAVIADPEGLSVAVLEYPKQQNADPASRQIHMQRIQEGRDNGTQVEVTRGLEGWEYVVVNPSDAVREGALVRTQAAQQKGPADTTPLTGSGSKQQKGAGGSAHQ
jgi:hypothetical protein